MRRRTVPQRICLDCATSEDCPEGQCCVLLNYSWTGYSGQARFGCQTLDSVREANTAGVLSRDSGESNYTCSGR